MKQADISALIKEFSNPVAVQTVYIKMLDGDVAAALLLSQLIYWSSRTKDPEGWVYKTYAEWYKEIGLTKYRIARSSDVLEKLGIIQAKRRRRGTNHQGPVAMHYRLFDDVLTKVVTDFVFNSKETRQSDGEETLQSDSKETRQSDSKETSPLINIDYTKDYTTCAKGAGEQPSRKEEDAPLEKPREESKAQPSKPDNKDSNDPLSFLPPLLRPLGEVFLEEGGHALAPQKSDRTLWVKTLNNWYTHKIDGEAIRQAVAKMRSHRPEPLTISGPQSVTKVALSCLASREVSKSNVFQPGDYLE